MSAPSGGVERYPTTLGRFLNRRSILKENLKLAVEPFPAARYNTQCSAPTCSSSMSLGVLLTKLYSCSSGVLARWSISSSGSSLP